MDEFYRGFGDAVRAARLRAGLSQRTLGERVGLTRTSITNLESGQQHIPLHLLVALARALGVDSCALLPPDDDLNDAGAMPPLRELAPAEGDWVRSVVRGVPDETH